MNFKINTRISITDKFILYFVLVFFFATLIISGSIYYSSKEALMDRTFEQLTSIKTVKKRQIESLFRDRLEDFKNLKFVLRTGNNNKSNLDVDFIKSYLYNYLSNNKYFDAYFIINENSHAYLSEMKRDYDSNSILKNFTNEIINSSSDENLFIKDYIYNPVTYKYELYIIGSLTFISDNVSKTAYENSNYRPKTLLGLRISTDAINNIMLEKNPREGLGNSGESYLVGNDFLMRSKSRFIDNSILKIRVQTEATIRAFGNENSIQLIHDYRNIPVLSSFEKLNIPGLNWVVLAEFDNDEAFMPVTEIRRKIYILAIVLSAVIFAVTYFITKKITKPLVMLNDATTKLTNGEFVSKLKVKSKDEIGELAQSFNILSDTLLKNQEDLKNETLKRFSLVMDAQEKEKERLSRELHDGIGQLFIALKLNLESIDDSGNNAGVAISNVKKGLDDIITEIRQISNNLMPAVLNELGLSDAIRNMCNQLNSLSKIHFSFETDLNQDITDRKKKIYIFRIIQEALNNVVKHSGASNAEIKLMKNSNYKLIISDDGIGFNYDEAIKGFGNGLYNIRERVLSLEGKINIEASPGNGTLLIIKIPG